MHGFDVTTLRLPSDRMKQVAQDLARTVATAALHVFPNTTMNRHHDPGPGTLTPAVIRRAVAHIDAHAHLPLQLSEIAAAAGTSTRALQYGFRRRAPGCLRRAAGRDATKLNSRPARLPSDSDRGLLGEPAGQIRPIAPSLRVLDHLRSPLGARAANATRASVFSTLVLLNTRRSAAGSCAHESHRAPPDRPQSMPMASSFRFGDRQFAQRPAPQVRVIAWASWPRWSTTASRCRGR